MGAYTDLFIWRAVQKEGCLYLCSLCFFLLLYFCTGINIFSLPDGLRHLLGDYNPTYISMCCVIYDLEGSNDAYLLDANLTSDDAKNFQEELFL